MQNKNNLIFITTLIFLLLCSISGFSRKLKLDSLKQVKFDALKIELTQDFALGKYPIVVKKSGDLLRMYEKDAQIHYMLGIAKQKLGSYDNALLSLERAIDLDKEYAIAYQARGVSYYNLGSFGMAATDFQKAYDLTQNQLLLLEVGKSQMMGGMHEDAINSLKKINDQEVHGERAMMGKVFMNMGEFEKAKLEFQYVFKNEQENDSIYDDFLEVLLRLKEYENIIKTAADIYFKSDRASDIEALAHLKAEKYEEGIIKFEDLIYKKPTAFRYNGLAQIYLKKADKEKAISFFEKSTELNSLQPKIQEELAKLYFEKQLFNEALRTYKVATKMDKSNYFLYQQQGLCYFYTGEYKKAIKEFKNSLKQKADDEKSIAGFFFSTLMLGKTKKAEQIIKNAIKIQPSSGLYEILLAYTYYKQFKYEQAAQSIEAAENKDIESKTPLYIIKNLILTATAKYEEALKVINKIPENDSSIHKQFGITDAFSPFLKAKSLNNLGRYEESIKILNKEITNKYLTREQIHAQLGDIYFAKTQFKQALTHYDTVVRLLPYNIEGILGKAKTYHMLRKFDNVLDFIDRAYELDEHNIELYHFSDLVYNELGKKKEFKKLLRKGRRKANTQNQKHYLRTLDYLKKNDFDDAIKTLKKCNLKDNSNIDNSYIFALMSRLETIRRNFDLALESIDKAIEINQINYAFKISRSKILFDQERYEDAIKYLGKIIEITKHPNAYLYRADSYMKIDDQEKACLDYKEAAKYGNKRAHSIVLLNCN